MLEWVPFLSGESLKIHKRRPMIGEARGSRRSREDSNWSQNRKGAARPGYQFGPTGILDFPALQCAQFIAHSDTSGQTGIPSSVGSRMGHILLPTARIILQTLGDLMDDFIGFSTQLDT